MTTNWDETTKLSSTDENVAKYVFKKGDAVAESVLYKYPSYKSRTVICCSTQSGCPVGCRFCGAGDYFNRSLTWREIVEQPVKLITDACNEEGIHWSTMEKLQIMFMSMGEPLLNIDELIKALRYLHEKYPQAQLLISTSAPRNFKAFEKLQKVSEEIPTIGLQFSVHESTDEARKKLIPSATCTLQEISSLGQQWAKATGRRPYFNYCVHDSNNRQEDVARLSYHFDPGIWECTLSVICERDEHVAAANARQRELVEEFMAKMLKLHYSIRMFDPAGQDDIGGGCGQLWYVQDWMKEHPDLVKKSAGHGKAKVHTPS